MSIPGVYAGEITPLEGQARFGEYIRLRQPRSLRYSEDALRTLCENQINEQALAMVLGLDTPGRNERKELRRIAGAARSAV